MVHIWRPWKLYNFQDPLTPLPIYVQNSSIPLNLNLQFQTIPLPSLASLQMITNQLKENIIQAWLLQVIRSFFQVDFCFQQNSFTLSGFPLSSFYLAEASLSSLLCHYALVCAFVQKYHEIQIFSTPFAISLLQSTNYGTRIAPCMGKNKNKTMLHHIQSDHAFYCCSIYPTSNAMVSLKYSFTVLRQSQKKIFLSITYCLAQHDVCSWRKTNFL